MSNELSKFEALCLVQHQIAEQIVAAFQTEGCLMQKMKSISKITKALQKRPVDAILLEFPGDNYNDLVIWSKEIKTHSPNSSLVVALPGSMPLFPPELDLNSVDLILSLDQNFDLLKQRISQQWNLNLTPQVEGRAKKMVDIFLERSASWPRLGEIAEVEEGITMDHPEKNLKNSRATDKDVAFLLNGQIKNFYIQGLPSFWTPDSDLILSGPSKSTLELKPRLMLHSSGPPLKAAIDREGRYFGRSSYAIIPKVELELESLLVYLNSRMVDFYFNKIFIPVGQQLQSNSYLRGLDFKNLPIPKAFLESPFTSCRDKVLEMEMLLQSGAGRRHVRVMELQKQLDAMIFDQFKFDPVDLQHLEKLHF